MNGVLEFEMGCGFDKDAKISKLHNSLWGIDIKMVESFDLEKLEQAEKDAKLLLEIIQARKEQLNKVKINYDGSAIIDREYHKQVIKIEVTEYIIGSDINGNYKYLSNKIVENIVFSYKKSDLESIERLKVELARIKEKYSLELVPKKRNIVQ